MRKCVKKISHHNLTGWQRAWLVASAALFIVYLIVAAVLLPPPSSISHSRVYLNVSGDIQQRVDQADSLPKPSVKTSVTMANGYLAKLDTNVQKRKDVPWLVEYDNVLKRELMKDRLVLVAEIMAGWLLTCGVIYGFGSGVAWMRRGFVAQQSSAGDS